MAIAAGRADFPDNGQDNVLGGDVGRQFAVHPHQHVLGLLLNQRLGGQHMLDLGSADAVGQGAEGTMGRGMAVAADNGHAGQGEALFGADNVNNALTLVEGVEIFDAELAGILGQSSDLDRAFGVRIGQRTVGGGHIVVNHGQGALGMAHLAVVHPQALKGLRAGDFVHQVPVDIEERRAVLIVLDQMVVPDLVVECARLGHWCLPAWIVWSGSKPGGQRGQALPYSWVRPPHCGWRSLTPRMANMPSTLVSRPIRRRHHRAMESCARIRAPILAAAAPITP